MKETGNDCILIRRKRIAGVLPAADAMRTHKIIRRMSWVIPEGLSAI